MSTQSFNKDFANQFTQDVALHSPSEEYKYGNLLMRTYAASRGDMALLGKTVTDQFFKNRNAD